jgi:hypothetical protein
MDKFIEVKDATRHANKHNEYRSSSVDARQTSRVRFCFVFFQINLFGFFFVV